MRLFKPAALAMLAAFAIASPAFAQSESERMANNTYVVVMPDGRLVRMQAKDHAAMEMLMKEATEVKAGQIFFYANGKLYMAPDKKMSDGKMLFEHIGGRA